MTGIFNGLAVTRTRLALLRAIHSDPGRVYLDPEEHVVWDMSLGMRVTERVREMVQHGWVRALSPGEQRGRHELPERTYYRVIDIGRQVLASQIGQKA